MLPTAMQLRCNSMSRLAFMPQEPIIEPAALPSLGQFRLLDVRKPAAFEADNR